MRDDELKALFDQQAATYDARWSKTAAIREALHLLLAAVFAELPAEAEVLCVGAGTGDEIVYLAQRFPNWRFTAVEPSGAMVEVLRAKAQRGGFASRCVVHEGYLASLPAESPTSAFDAATCLLVSQFILDQQARRRFFESIAQRLRPGGILASSDLSAEPGTPRYEALLKAWLAMMTSADVPAEGLEQMRAAYGKDVAILPPTQVASLIRSAGFEEPVAFYQAGLIHGWFSRRAPGGPSHSGGQERERDGVGG